MLKELHIKNVAVIDEIRIEFKDGFNVLTGETGAGKSILIDSINMALGGRTGRDIIRSGCDFALTDLCFETENPAILAALSELGIDIEDGFITLSRRLSVDGKSVFRINGGIVPSALVREVAGLIIDIHGQSDNQFLLSSKNHLKFLDAYASLSDELLKYKEEFAGLKALKRQIDELSMDEDEKARRFDMLKFQAEEIRLANLKPLEDEELIEARDRLYNMESIISGAGTAYGALYGSESGSAFDLLKTAVRALSDICRFDSTLLESYDRLQSATTEVQDIASDINSCLSKTDFNMAELDLIEERLDLIGNLKRKYGNSIEEIIEFGKKCALEAESIEKSDEKLLELQKEFSLQSSKVSALAEAISKMRKTAAHKKRQRSLRSPKKETEGSKQGFPVSSLRHLQACPEQVHEPLCLPLEIEIAAESLQSCSLEVFFQRCSLCVVHRVGVPAPPIDLFFLRRQQIIDRSADRRLFPGAHQAGRLIMELLRLAVSLFEDTCPDDQGIDRISQKGQG